MSSRHPRLRYRRHSIPLLLLMTLGLPGLSSGAVEVTNLGPLTYMRNPGKPTVYTNDFPGIAGAGVLHIQNSAVSSAVIRLNGTEVAAPSVFNQQVQSSSLLVTLAEQNRLEIELRSQPGSSLSVRVTQQVEAEGAAVVGPAGGAVAVMDPTSSIFGTKLDVPAGALGKAVVLSIDAAPQAPMFSDGEPGLSPVRLGPSGLTFLLPVTLTLAYEEGALDPLSSLGPDTLGLYTFDERSGNWLSLPTDPVDTVQHLVSSPAVTHFSVFALKDDRFTAGCVPGTLGAPEYLPVVLVHGFQPTLIDTNNLKAFCGYGDGGTFGQLPNLLNGELGADVFSFLYDSGRSIPRSAEYLERAIERIRGCYSQKPPSVTVISHSQGGLVARAAFERFAQRGVPIPAFKLATLATPHLGTALPYLLDLFPWWVKPTAGLLCPSALELEACSSFLEGADGCLTPLGGLNGTTRQTPRKLSSPGSDYHLYVGADDLVVVPRTSALGNFPFFDILEPPALSPSERVKVEVPDGCTADGQGGCGHSGSDGIANVSTTQHVMWRTLRDIVVAGVWERDPPSSGSITRRFEFTAKTGPLAPFTGTGFFTYDRSIVPSGGGGVYRTGLLTDLSLSFGGKHWDETMANTGWIYFHPSGDLMYVVFGNACHAGGCQSGGGTDEWYISVGNDGVAAHRTFVYGNYITRENRLLDP